MYLEDYNDIEMAELGDLSIFTKEARQKIGEGIKKLASQVKSIVVPKPQIAPQVAPQVAPVPQPAPVVVRRVRPVPAKTRPFYLNPIFIGGVGLAIIILILVLKKKKQNVSLPTTAVTSNPYRRYKRYYGR